MASPDEDRVFKALGDPTRRAVLDALRRRGPATLSRLCEDVAMTRQSLTQHVDLLVDAGLVLVVRRGRERWHYLNAAPIHEIGRRWIARFDHVHLTAIGVITDLAEETPMSTLPDYVYVTYINAPAERVWEALTDPRVTAIYWNGMANTSGWQPGDTWTHRTPDGGWHYDIWGKVLEAEPPRRLVFTFQPAAQGLDQQGSVVTYEIEPAGELVRLTVTHTDLPDEGTRHGISLGWPTVLSSLKTYLETGRPLEDAAWTLMGS